MSSSPGIQLGNLGEAYAAAYLEQRGYRLVAANFTLPVGRNLRGAVVNAEIDIVAYEGETLCFVEVKTRASDWFAPPQVNVDYANGGRLRVLREPTAACLSSTISRIATTSSPWSCPPGVHASDQPNPELLDF